MHFLSTLNIDMMLIVVTGNPSSRKIRPRLYATAMPHGYVALATVNAIWLLMAWRRQGDRALVDPFLQEYFGISTRITNVHVAM